MTLKNRGYLLVDIAIAMTIFSVFSLSIFTFYKTYKGIDTENKIRVEGLDYVNCISMEIKHNLTFDDLLNLKIGEDYFLNIEGTNDIKKLIADSGVKKILDSDYRQETGNVVIKIDNGDFDNNDFFNVKVTFKKYMGEKIYENENIIRKYRFLE